MNADHKKSVLRMIPCGIYVLTADDGKGNISAATVNWVTQTAFAPPLLVVGVRPEQAQKFGAGRPALASACNQDEHRKPPGLGGRAGQRPVRSVNGQASEGEKPQHSPR